MLPVRAVGQVSESSKFLPTSDVIYRPSNPECSTPPGLNLTLLMLRRCVLLRKFMPSSCPVALQPLRILLSCTEQLHPGAVVVVLCRIDGLQPRHATKKSIAGLPLHFLTLCPTGLPNVGFLSAPSSVLDTLIAAAVLVDFATLPQRPISLSLDCVPMLHVCGLCQ